MLDCTHEAAAEAQPDASMPAQVSGLWDQRVNPLCSDHCLAKKLMGLKECTPSSCRGTSNSQIHLATRRPTTRLTHGKTLQIVYAGCMYIAISTSRFASVDRSVEKSHLVAQHECGGPAERVLVHRPSAFHDLQPQYATPCKLAAAQAGVLFAEAVTDLLKCP